jgi:hypothetical protein
MTFLGYIYTQSLSTGVVTLSKNGDGVDIICHPNRFIFEKSEEDHAVATSQSDTRSP